MLHCYSKVIFISPIKCYAFSYFYRRRFDFQSPSRMDRNVELFLNIEKALKEVKLVTFNYIYIIFCVFLVTFSFYFQRHIKNFYHSVINVINTEIKEKSTLDCWWGENHRLLIERFFTLQAKLLTLPQVFITPEIDARLGAKLKDIVKRHNVRIYMAKYIKWTWICCRSICSNLGQFVPS